MMTEADIQEAKRAAEMWRLNDERNKRLEAEKKDLFERSYISAISGLLESARRLGKDAALRMNR